MFKFIAERHLPLFEKWKNQRFEDIKPADIAVLWRGEETRKLTLSLWILWGLVSAIYLGQVQVMPLIIAQQSG